MIIHKYGHQDQWITPPLTSTYGTNIWKTVWKLWKEYAVNIRFTVGNGRRIYFWFGTWLRHGPPKDLFPDLFCLDNFIWACNRGDVELRGTESLLHKNPKWFGDWYVAEMLQSLESFHGTSNQWRSHIELRVANWTPFVEKLCYVYRKLYQLYGQKLFFIRILDTLNKISDFATASNAENSATMAIILVFSRRI